MNNETGGFAFPRDPAFSDGNCDGMTLRDYFAAKAMQGILAGTLNPDAVWSQYEVAETAYNMADAMLKARRDTSGVRSVAESITSIEECGDTMTIRATLPGTAGVKGAEHG